MHTITIEAASVDRIKNRIESMIINQFIMAPDGIKKTKNGFEITIEILTRSDILSSPLLKRKKHEENRIAFGPASDNGNGKSRGCVEIAAAEVGDTNAGERTTGASESAANPGKRGRIRKAIGKLLRPRSRKKKPGYVRRGRGRPRNPRPVGRPRAKRPVGRPKGSKNHVGKCT
jgi:hypothetical protein